MDPMREEDRLSGMGLPRCKVEIIVFKYMLPVVSWLHYYRYSDYCESSGHHHSE